MGVLIRHEQSADTTAIRDVLEAAFDTAAEAKIVDALRADGAEILSLVAEDAGQIVGSVVFSPVELSGHSDLNVVGLAPIGVLPARQGENVGGKLIEAGVAECEERGVEAVFLLGDPAYYGRFGFGPAESFGIDSEYQVPAGYFMVRELKRGTMARTSGGTIRYLPAFQMV
ncbi:MAG: N-acetyltransferase [Pseudomonadota bacterium]